MSEIIRNPAVQAEKNIAKARAVRPEVDSNGRPVSAMPTYTYDDNGRLVEAAPAKTPPSEEPQREA